MRVARGGKFALTERNIRVCAFCNCKHFLKVFYVYCEICLGRRTAKKREKNDKFFKHIFCERFFMEMFYVCVCVSNIYFGATYQNAMPLIFAVKHFYSK